MTVPTPYNTYGVSNKSEYYTRRSGIIRFQFCRDNVEQSNFCDDKQNHIEHARNFVYHQQLGGSEAGLFDSSSAGEGEAVWR